MTIVGILFFGLMFVGLPIGYVLGLAGVAGLIQVGGENFLAMAPKRYFEGLDLFTFMAMPFFILAGEIMNRSGITMRLVAFTDSLVGYLRGGLAHSNMVASVIFAGMTGAAVSDAAAFGNTLVPAMISKGYPKPFACAVVRRRLHHRPDHPALEPDGHLRLAHGGLDRRAVRGRDPAGPAHLPLLHVLHRGHRPAHRPAQGRRRPEPVADRDLFQVELPRAAHAGHHPGRHPVRHRHPDRGGGHRRALRLVVGVGVYRAITFKDIIEMLVRTSLITGVVFLIIASASILSWWMTFEQIPQVIAKFFLSISRDPQMVTLMILILLLVIGMFMDINAALIILAPVLGPLTQTIGMDPVHAGIMIVLALNIGLMTPPVGACLFVICSITGIRLEALSKAIWPFILIEVAVLFLIAFLPQMTMFMPHLLLGK